MEDISIWSDFNLKTPIMYTKQLPRTLLYSLIADRRGVRQAAKHLGVSEGFLIGELRSRINWEKPIPLSWDKDECLIVFEKYGSVRFVARMMGCTESLVRKRVAELGIELAPLIDYSTGDNSNAKGRRAELDFAAMRGEAILKDKNLVEGSQAEYDFDDAKLGRVNVKSAGRQRYKAKTRSKDPFFWKWSTRGACKCDCFAVLCYDEDMKTLIGYTIIASVGDFKKSEILQQINLYHPEEDEWGII